MELDVKRKGVFSTIFSAFREGVGGLIAAGPIDEIEDARDNPILKEYVKANPGNEELLKPIQAEVRQRDREKKHKKVVEEVEIQPIQPQVKKATVQEIEEEKEQEK